MSFIKCGGILFVICGILMGSTVAGQKSGKQFLNPKGVLKPVGYTQVVSVPSGKMIFVSGQGGSSSDGKLPADFAAQARKAFENISLCLAAAGARFEDIVKVNYYLTDLSNTAELRRIRAQYLNAAAPPASTLVQAGLLGSGLLVEIDVIAIIPGQSDQP
jgi:enamine deaminase RidA (YjgF/YER057c/UK114 family)